MIDPGALSIEVRPAGRHDPDGQHAASVLDAYFSARQLEAFRQLLWPRLAAIVVVAWLVESSTRWLPKAGFVFVFVLSAGMAAAAAIGEWRAKKHFRHVLDSLDQAHN